MIDKSKYICSAPFSYTEVYDDRQFLCCPSWLPIDVNDGNGIASSFNSPKSKEIRESILDGSYKYCNEIQCPYLARLKNNQIPNGFVPKTKESIKHFEDITHPLIVNFCFDRSCNFQCPSCRNYLINYTGKLRNSVDLKLKEVEDEISSYIKRLYLSGSADPFYSKSFRQFLINLDSNKFKNLQSIHLHTNASLWNESMWDKMKSVHPYVNSCEISIDAAQKDTYEKHTRIGGNWEVLLDNLNFITMIPTIRHYIFSFVVQDTNYTEMYDFYRMIESYMKVRNDKIKWEVKTNVITNWGTYNESDFNKKDVSNPSHEKFSDFMTELDKIKSLPNIVHNFHHLYQATKNLI
jgi:pyruvate-formate lyase-activating enzyme